MTVEEIRAVLANPVAWAEVLERVSSADCGCTHCEDVRRALASYCDERARTLAQALVAEQADRDAAVRALLAELHVARMALAVRAKDGLPVFGRLHAAIAAVRRFYPEGT